MGTDDPRQPIESQPSQPSGSEPRSNLVEPLDRMAEDAESGARKVDFLQRHFDYWFSLREVSKKGQKVTYEMWRDAARESAWEYKSAEARSADADMAGENPSVPHTPETIKKIIDRSKESEIVVDNVSRNMRRTLIGNVCIISFGIILYLSFRTDTMPVAPLFLAGIVLLCFIVDYLLIASRVASGVFGYNSMEAQEIMSFLIQQAKGGEGGDGKRKVFRGPKRKELSEAAVGVTQGEGQTAQ